MPTKKPKPPPSVLPQPLLDALVEDRVLPLVGAGFSVNAKLPMGRTMPLWAQLGREIEDEVGFLTTRADALEVISAYGAEHGRQALVARLRRALHDGFAEPGPTQIAFAQLPFDVVVTTNFDSILEDAYRRVRRPIRTLIREDQLASLVPASAVSLVKAHGDLDNEPVLVVTEQDYDEFILRRPLLATYLANLLITRVALLVGYSLTDPDWRQLLATVRTRLGRSQQVVYAMEVDATPPVVERYRRRGVSVINLESAGRPYGEVLTQAFSEMRAHIAAHALDHSVVHEEGALEELRSANRSERRLCLFLVPERLVAYYRDQVFPAVREVGVEPVTPYDVDAGGPTLYATAMGLMEQAAAIVADLSMGETGAWFEMGLALSAEPSRRGRLAVVGHERALDPYLRGQSEAQVHFFREHGLDLAFPARLAEWLADVLGPTDPREPRTDEAWSKRLGRDPEWEVVRAYRDLEIALAAALGTTRTIRAALQSAVETRLLTNSLAARLRDGYRLRNEILHAGRTPTQQDAERVLATVREALRVLDGAEPKGRNRDTRRPTRPSGDLDEQT